MDYSDFFIGICVGLIALMCVETIGLGRDLITHTHITQANEVCADNDGLNYINGQSPDEHKFICNNDAVFTYQEILDR